MKRLFALFAFLFASSAFALPDDMLIYYGYVNSFNSAVNGWSNDAVVTDIGSHYKIVVLGDGVQSPSHPDYANASYIIAHLKSAYPTIKIFGYVDAAQALEDFQYKASEWDTLEVNGIFIDRAGYDFGKTRHEMNQRVQFIHEMNFATKAFVNAWNIDHVLGTTNDPSYPNTTYNASAEAALLASNDYYLMESFVIVSGAYDNLDTWLARGDKVKAKVAAYPIKVATVAIIDNTDAAGQVKFDLVYKGSYLFHTQASGSSDLLYGASTAQVKYWTRPTVSHL